MDHPMWCHQGLESVHVANGKNFNTLADMLWHGLDYGKKGQSTKSQIIYLGGGEDSEGLYLEEIMVSKDPDILEDRSLKPGSKLETLETSRSWK